MTFEGGILQISFIDRDLESVGNEEDESACVYETPSFPANQEANDGLVNQRFSPDELKEALGSGS